MSDAQPAQVWIFQPRIEHYRLPVFDALLERSAGLYELKVFGPTRDGEAFGGGRRPYINEFAYHNRSIAGARFSVWPDMTDVLLAGRPEVVIANAHLRRLNCWRFPSLCRRIGSAAVGWGKVHSFSGLPAPLLRFAKALMFNRFDLFIAYGQRSRDELIDLGMNSEKIFVAQNTIDTSRIFYDEEKYLSRANALRKENNLENARVVLSVARFDPEKRLGDLLAAWPKLRALDPRLHLVFVGGGALLEDVRRQAGVVDAERIVVTGRVPEGDDYAWIAAADVTVQCGAVGLAMNQSMAFGTPTVIADEFGADTEILEHGRTGWRYPRGDADALAAAVAAVFDAPERTMEITQAARALVRDSVTIDQMADSIHRCIEAALSIAQARRR